MRRYDVWGYGYAASEDVNGDWVKYEDVEDLLKRVAALEESLSRFEEEEVGSIVLDVLLDPLTFVGVKSRGV